jgi:hypothetical protein
LFFICLNAKKLALWLFFHYIISKGGCGFGGKMNLKKVNVHCKNVIAITVKKKLKGNDTWGREFMSFCMQNVDDKTLSFISDDMILERKLLSVV